MRPASRERRSRRERRTGTIAPDVHVDPAAAVGLAELPRRCAGSRAMSTDADALRQPRDVAVPAPTAHRHNDVKALGARRLHPRPELELGEEIAQPQHADRSVRIVVRRIQSNTHRSGFVSAGAREVHTCGVTVF